MTKEQINSRLVEIYQLLNRIQELADAVMYNSFKDNAIKEVFFKLVRVKARYFKRRTF